MRSWKISPDNTNIAKYVDCYWLLEKTQSDSSPEHPKLNPDPAAHLILSKPEQYYKYEQNSMSFTGHGGHLMLPHSKFILIDHSQPFLIIGIKFHVGALYSLPLLTSHAMLDKIISVDVKKLFESELDFLMQLTDQPDVCRNALDKYLMPCLLDSHEDKHSNLVRHALPILANTPISEVGAALGCSQRTIERSFSRVTGLTLKQNQSMNRLEVMLNHLYKLKDNNINWSDIAAQFGFSDQPHLIRYLKSNIGTTPGNYSRQRDLAIDVYGNFE